MDNDIFFGGKKLYSYFNRIIRVNLTDNIISKESLEEKVLRKFIGGSGLGAKLLYEEVKAGVDPLSPQNKVFFLTGLFCGANIPTSDRLSAVTKSPLTRIFAESDVGGFWGYELKKAGYNGIIIEGKSNNPIYIYINDSNIEIRNAKHLWGKGTYEVDEMLKKELLSNIQVMSIGPAGERLVKFASIMTGGRDGRALGRCGIGAVMGSKNLKAIVVKGSQKTEVFDKVRLIESIKSIANGIKEATVSMTRYGTAGGVIYHEGHGNFPLKNWKMGRWPEGAKNISGHRMAETILVKNYRCRGCIIGCGRVVKIEKGLYKGVDGAGPEYETIGNLGGLCLVDNLEAIAYANELCNQYGMDTISTGAVIAFAMELYENGIITKQDTDGLEVNFGSVETLIELIKMIADRRGIGKILGEGVRNAAREIGGLAGEYAIHVKGLEFPAHDPRAYNGLALSYATSNRGACHLAGFTRPFESSLSIPELGYDKPHNRYIIDGKGEFVAKMQNLMCIFDSLKLCKYLLSSGIKINTIIEWMKYAIGWEDYSFEELMITGERIYNIKRLFNIKCGISRKDDMLPMRFLTEKREGPGIITNLPHLGKMLNDYYNYRDWSEEGIPKESKLKKLDLI